MKRGLLRHRVLPLVTAVSFAFMGAGMVAALQTKLVPTATDGFLQRHTGNATTLAASSSATVPDSNYDKSGGKFVATNGNDANAGTEAAPFATLKKAIQSAGSGGKIVMRGGVYREGVLNSDGTNNTTLRTLPYTVTIQAYPHEQVWLDGTVVVSSGWTGTGPYTLANSPSRFLCKPSVDQCVESLSQVSAGYPMANSPQMVFCNGTPLNEVSSVGAVSSNNFYFDQSTNALTVGANACGTNVEITVQPQALANTKPNFKFLGIGVRHYGSVQKPSLTAGGYYSGMVNVNSGSTGALVENSLFFQSASRGLNMSGNSGASDNVTVRSSQFVENGMNGVDAFTMTNTLFESNYIARNNAEHFAVGSSSTAVIAGSKMVTMTNVTVRDNVFEENDGTGWWCDIKCNGFTVVRNISRRNNLHGLYTEISTGGSIGAVIASNLVYSNAGSGIKNSSDNVYIYNNTLVKNKGNILAYVDNREGTTVQGQLLTDVTNVRIKNNILSNSYPSSNTYQLFDTGSTTAHGVDNMFSAGKPDYNLYQRDSASAPTRLVKWCAPTSNCTTFYNDLATFKGTGSEANGKEVTGSGQLFANEGAENYQLKTASQGLCTGEALPAIVSNAVGATQNNRGALKWPGSPAIPACPGGGGGGSTDTTAPTVALTSPTDNATVSGGTVVLAATASDNIGISKVDFLVDGQVLASDTSAPYSASWDTTSASNTDHSVQAKAYDAAGNTTSSSVITAKVQNNSGGGSTTQPPITVGPGGSGSIVPTNPLPADQTKKVEVYVDGKLVGTAEDGKVPAIDTSTLSNGTHTITVKATGKDGKEVTSSQEVHVLAKQSLYQKVRNFIFKPLAGRSATLLNTLFASGTVSIVLMGAISFIAYRRGWFHWLYGASQHVLHSLHLPLGHVAVAGHPNLIMPTKHRHDDHE